MSNLFKVSEAASLAIHGMILMAQSPAKPLSAKDMASGLEASEAHLAKVLQRLGRAGLVRSTRGPKGGFVLGKPPDAITLLDIYEAIEGPLETIACLLGRPICGGGQLCCMGGLLQTVGEQVRQHLARTRLLDLTRPVTAAKEGPKTLDLRRPLATTKEKKQRTGTTRNSTPSSSSIPSTLSIPSTRAEKKDWRPQ